MGTVDRDQALREQTRVGRSVLENLVLGARNEGPPEDRELLCAQLDQALATLIRFSTMDYRSADWLPCIDEVRARIQSLIDRSEPAAAAAQSAAWQRRLAGLGKQLDRCRRCAIEVLVAHQGELLRPEDAPASSEALRFVASSGVPALHHLAQPSVEPAGPAHSAQPADGLDAGEREQLLRQSRDCLSDLAALSGLRRPLADLPWTAVEPFEQRLLDALDALVALGIPTSLDCGVGWGVLGEVQRYGAEALVPDAGREFARAFTLCCLDGDDHVAAALLALRQVPSSVYRACRDALCLASSPRLGPRLAELLPSVQGELLLLLLESLRFRREASFSSLLSLTAHLDAAVLAAATRGLGYVDRTDAVVHTLHRVLEEDDHDLVAVEVASSLLLHGELSGLGVARGHLGDVALLSEKGRLGHLRLIALCGAASDLDLVRQCLAPTPRDAELVGWYGHAGLVPWLIATLRQANAAAEAMRPLPHPLELGASQALYRITGAELRDETLAGADDEPTTLPARSALLWDRWWQERGTALPIGTKWRFGRPYEPLATVDELLGPSLARHRADGALELGIVVGPSRFEPSDWVARQRDRLGAVRARLENARATYGAGRFAADQLARRALYSGY
jgi:hypothetical protein